MSPHSTTHKINKGQALPEYALILVFLALGLIGVLTWFGNDISNFFSNFSSTFNSVVGAALGG